MLDKKIYKKPTANILMWGDYNFPFKTGKKVRMSALTSFNAIPIKFQQDFCYIDKFTSKMIWKGTGLRRAKII